MEFLYIINNNNKFLSPYTGGGSNDDLLIVPHGVLGPERALSLLLAIPPPPYLLASVATLPYLRRPGPGSPPAPPGIREVGRQQVVSEQSVLIRRRRRVELGTPSPGIATRSAEALGRGYSPGRSALEASSGGFCPRGPSILPRITKSAATA